ncbi:STAS domain-containing protein [Actinoplanes sp. NBC_00393]|uniref:STAS domain-containing protein n=1 Tax=Actinoplanes sp. NBC_00393 TaxID=2975953 RepID=UPI002E1A158C
MRINRQQDADTVRVELQGELDLASSGGVRTHLEQVVHEMRPRRILVDMGGVTFCDSTGLEALICVRDVATEHGTALQLINVHGVALITLQITGVFPLLVAEPDAE